jgi:hypothetical protein
MGRTAKSTHDSPTKKGIQYKGLSIEAKKLI